MTVSWEFYRQQPTDPVHNPISGEFFSTEAVRNVAESLVRESIQNSLDARLTKPDGSRELAQVRIYLSEASGALPHVGARRWFGSLWPHVEAPGNGLRDLPRSSDPCPFMVFEDFGTFGLTGDPGEYRVVENVKNHFLSFFRAEGHSDKGENDRGSWGVGKTVFPRASRISSFLAYTIRETDSRRLMLGRSILKFHGIGTDRFKSDGYLGVRRASDNFMLPSDDVALLSDLRRDFCLKRNGETGLSVIVPWYETSGDDAVTHEKVVAAVLRGFFYPILMGKLSVTIATPSREIEFEAATIISKVEAIGGELALELLPLIRLAEWAQTRLDTEFSLLVAPEPNRAQKWSAELVPVDLTKYIRDTLAQRQRIALRVPLTVQLRNGGPEETHFRVFIEHCEENAERPVFIRDELIISDARAPRVAEVRALVIVDHGPLAGLLRDAETPAHTQWNQETSHFKNKYKTGPSVIEFVRRSVSALLSIVNQAGKLPDPSLTIDFFSVPAPPTTPGAVEGRRRKPRKKDGSGPHPPPPPPPPARPRRFRIDTLRGGFAVRRGDPDAVPPEIIDIRVAYDVRRGSALKKYDEADFDVGRSPIRVEAERGIEVLSAKANRMRVALKEPDFSLQVGGFDPDRDLYVKAEAVGGGDAD